MQRKAYVSGAAVLLAALLAGCSGGSGVGSSAPDSKGGDTGTTAPVAQPGKYRTLPEACGAADHDTLDTLLPGIQQIADETQQEKEYEGDATLTYDTDRRDGCNWKVESASGTDHLFVDFERVVSYDNAVSDDSKAEELYAVKQTAADLPEPAASTSASAPASGSASPSPSGSAATPADGNTGAVGDDGDASGAPSAPSASASASQAPADLQPRVLDDLGDEAFIDDKLSTGPSTAQQRTVTVVFRTSNVIVTIEYAEQPTASANTPDSEEMQDRARKLARELSGKLNG
ncbi:DUF3558 domain-containing protein [Streptomyces rhizosphaerihabitans]|uniref:DUF3558 domain-containing protein n=1 Tax=Streptomyces rhizosphaerihabitans TaxID=1266770 RepID=UPI0021BEACA4|nr:DUF3558 domain-containing protein [Streptomyces rhizosphaerihabitans]MCT9006435.1 DUF3558 domain-containing protein [Streptomyces rhizosphaerihabitans]